MPLLTSQGAALSSHLIRFRLITLAYSAYLNLLYAPLSRHLIQLVRESNPPLLIIIRCSARKLTRYSGVAVCVFII